MSEAGTVAPRPPRERPGLELLAVLGVYVFTREITRFMQFMVLAVLIAVVFYTPGIVQALASGIAHALGVH